MSRNGERKRRGKWFRKVEGAGDGVEAGCCLFEAAGALTAVAFLLALPIYLGLF